MSKKVGLISLGCPKNLVDSEIMLGFLETAGYHIVVEPAKADILIVNTCSFIEDAKRESIDAIIEMARFKDMGSAQYLIITGCLPQRYKSELMKLFPEADLFVGTGEYQKIVALIKGLKDKRPRQQVGIPEYIHSNKTPRKLATPRHAVYVKIAEGCFHACSFCVIPRMRGRYRSRPEADIISEARRLLKNGAKELNIIAQDTTSYGRDLKGGANIATLLSKLADVAGRNWVRLLYAYPQGFKKGVVKLMKGTSGICRYIDIPIQHIDDNILYNMRRGRSEKLIRKLVGYIKDECPNIALRTSVITGFPGETDKQFRKLLDFISDGYFDHVGVFTYSEEEGTSAARMNGHLPARVKKERQQEILNVQKEISKKKLKMFVGKRLRVLVDGVSSVPDYNLKARTEFQAPDIDGLVYINNSTAQPGEFYSVEITRSYHYDLIGRVV